MQGGGRGAAGNTGGPQQADDLPEPKTPQAISPLQKAGGQKLVWFSGCWNTHSGAVYGLLILKKQPCDAYLGGGG